MRPILSIQSHVVYGHVGNDAAAFPLQRLGREVWPLMSVQFSSHTGYAGWRGRAFDADMIDECVSGLKAIGALSSCAGLLTGYLGKAEIGEAALRALSSLRAANEDAAWCCDPVIGDVGRGPYVPPEVAEFFRDRALAVATILTPNAFELEWLTGRPVRTLDEARAAVATILARGPRAVAVTSLVLDDTPPDALDVLAGDNPASGAHGRQGCRSPSTARATSSPLCSSTIGWTAARRRRRCRRRSHRCSGSSPRRSRRGDGNSR